MKARNFLVGAALILSLGTASAGETAIDEMVVTAKLATHSQVTPVDRLDLQSKEALSGSALVIELPKMEVELPRLTPEHG